MVQRGRPRGDVLGNFYDTGSRISRAFAAGPAPGDLALLIDLLFIGICRSGRRVLSRFIAPRVNVGGSERGETSGGGYFALADPQLMQLRVCTRARGDDDDDDVSLS